MMSIKKGNVRNHELVGMKVAIISSSNPYLEGIAGKVIDETKNMMLIESDKKVKAIVKSQCVFRFVTESGNAFEVDGKEISKAPEERIKKK